MKLKILLFVLSFLLGLNNAAAVEFNGEIEGIVTKKDLDRFPYSNCKFDKETSLFVCTNNYVFIVLVEDEAIFAALHDNSNRYKPKYWILTTLSDNPNARLTLGEGIGKAPKVIKSSNVLCEFDCKLKKINMLAGAYHSDFFAMGERLEVKIEKPEELWIPPGTPLEYAAFLVCPAD